MKTTIQDNGDVHFSKKTATSYLTLIRVRHYVKNVLVFAALACSGRLFELDKLASAAVGFVAFCAISSVVYVVNDIRDREKDRLHPTKRERPIASGKISPQKASVLATLLLAVAAACCFWTRNVGAATLLGTYLLLNLGYSFGLKNVPLLDVVILASGFLIRVLYGAVATDIVVSNWLYLTVGAAAFFFAFGKRRNELTRTQSNNTRDVLTRYSATFLDKNMYMCLTLTNAFYALWSMDASTTERYGDRNLIFTVPIILLITMKYSFVVEGDSDGDPVEVLRRDKVLSALCLAYLTAMVTILYW